MNPPSYDIKDMLESFEDSSGLGLSLNTDLFIGEEPDKPADCVTIFDTPGGPPYLGLNKTTGYNYPSIQIRVRNTNYLDGWNLINAIKDSLHGRANETWNGTLYTLIQCMGEPAHLDWDSKHRARFICNFNLQRR